MNADLTLTNLMVIGSIGVNDKLVVFDGSVFNIRPNTTFRAAVRWWYGETRYNNFTSLHSVICSAMNLIELFVLRGEFEKASRLLDALPGVLTGLSNVKQTYRDDVEMSSKIQLLIRDVQHFLQRHRTPSPQLAPSPQPTAPVSPLHAMPSPLHAMPSPTRSSSPGEAAAQEGP
tara:strand:- start:1475 stop:1996 length:522 start_codon:yes stop_codon:yes gene_type:complete